MQLTIATCQFPISGDIDGNCRYITRQMRQAQRQGAQVAHFSEVALSGYAGVEFETFDGFDWARLAAATARVKRLAAKLGIWVLLGSTHRLTAPNKPHNCVYVIAPDGRVIERYDKMFCTGSPDCGGGDLEHYSPGSHLPLITVAGIRCGIQICHDFRYPELYREYRRRNVQVVFHSFHNGHSSKDLLARNNNIWGVIVPPTMQAHAASNYVWISANNTSARESSWPSFVVRPDGVISGRLKNNVAGVLISRIDTAETLYDASAAWRDRALNGVLHSGTLVDDRRSRCRTET